MRTLKHLVLLSLVVAVAVFLAAPSAFAKKALTEDELEMISAAGEPMIIHGDSVTYTDSTQGTLTLNGVQAGLMALTLNNVVGENQLATGLNIMSTLTNDIGGGTIGQANTITQSFASMLDWTAATLDPVPGTVSSCGNAAGATAPVRVVCVLSPSVATVPGQIVPLRGFSDVGIWADGDASVTVQPQYTLTLSAAAQAALVALVVNNVDGLNQVATGVNIAGGSVTFSPSLLLGGTGGAIRGLNQTNTINQFRGVPYGFLP